MKTRIFQILLSASVLAVAILAALSVPAGAQQQTVYVQLANGQVVPVTVDVPPGTPLSDIQLPGTPVSPPTTPKVPGTTPQADPPDPREEPVPRTPGGNAQDPTGDDTEVGKKDRKSVV